jgi:hypothetical protein
MVWVVLGIVVLDALIFGCLASIDLVRRSRRAVRQRRSRRTGVAVVTLPAGVNARQPTKRKMIAFAIVAVLILGVSAALAAAPPHRRGTSVADTSPQDQRISVTPPTGSGSSPAATSQGAAKLPSSSNESPASSARPTPLTPSATERPAAPTVSAISTSATTIRLEWQPVHGASRYSIQRSRSTARWPVVGTAGGGETAFIDTGLSSDTTFYYRVVAFVQGERLAPSDVVSATTDTDNPGPPSIISAVADGSSAVELTWRDVDGESGYRIERSADGINDWVPIGTTGRDVTSFTDADLDSATTYFYRLFAVSTNADSPASNVISATTDAESPSPSPKPGSSDSDEQSPSHGHRPPTADGGDHHGASRGNSDVSSAS